MIRLCSKCISEMKVLLLLASALVFLARSASAVVALTNSSLYPVCFADGDCEKVHKLRDHACFQYFCYPWRTDVSAEADEPAPELPLKLCRRSKECRDPATPEERPKCFRHPERRKVTNGVCVGPDETEMCETHGDCVDLGGKCCNGYCCNEEYFRAMGEMPCAEDKGCKVSIHGSSAGRVGLLVCVALIFFLDKITALQC